MDSLIVRIIENIGKTAIALIVRVFGLTITLFPSFLANIMWSILCGLPLMLCWNATMSYIFYLPPIGYFRAVCLAFMLSLFLAKNTVTFRKK